MNIFCRTDGDTHLLVDPQPPLQLLLVELEGLRGSGVGVEGVGVWERGMAAGGPLLSRH